MLEGELLPCEAPAREQQLLRRCPFRHRQDYLVNQFRWLETRLPAIRASAMRSRRLEIPIGNNALLDVSLEALTFVGLDLELAVAVNIAKVGDGARGGRRATRDLDDYLRCASHGTRDLLDLAR